MDDLAALGGVSVFFGTEPSSGIRVLQRNAQFP